MNDYQKATGTNGRTDGQTDRQTDMHISLTEPHRDLWSLVCGENSLQYCTPKLEMYLYSFPVWGSRFAMHLFESKKSRGRPDRQT